VIEEMLQIAAQSICDRPGDTPQQRASRTRQMVYSILGFEPRDGLEYMLATMIVGHFQLILQSMHEALWGQSDQIKARTKSGIVSLDRAMLGFIKTLRMIQHRPLARWAEDAKRQADAPSAPTPSPEWIADWAGMPQPEPTQTETSDAKQPEPTPAEPMRNVPPPRARTTKSPAHTPDDETRQHIAAFEDALAALTETLEEARGFDSPPAVAKAASGD
jgi:hypothetical protein